MREQARQQFSEQGLPTLRNEQWKYTSLRVLKKHIESVGVERSSTRGLNYVQPSQAIIKPTDFLNTENLNKTLDLSAHPLALLNTAEMHAGYEITVPDNTIVAEPIVITAETTDALAESNQQIRHIIKIGKNSQAKIIFKYRSATDKQYFINVIQEIHAGEGSTLEHIILQEHNQDVFHIEGVHIKQDRNAVVKSHALSTGAKLARFDIHAHYAGTGAECEMLGIYQASGKQHVDFHLNAEHKHPHCRTKQFYRGIVDDKARAVFNGRVAIHPLANKSVSEQTNNNLLLSNTAEVDTKPELEVYHDDVKAAHGATVGQLDKDALFYLQARGIARDEAVKMLRHAFLRAVTDEIECKEAKELFLQTLEANEVANGY